MARRRRAQGDATTDEFSAWGVAAVIESPALGEALIAAIRPLVPHPAEGHVALCATWSEFASVVAAGDPWLVVFDSAPPGAGRDWLHGAERRLPHATWVAAVAASPEGARRGVEFIRLGADDVWVMDNTVGDATGLAHVISSAIARRITKLVMEHCGPTLPVGVRTFLEQLWTRCSAPMTWGEGATLYGRHAATLQRHLRATGLPTLGKLIVWGRLFHAGYLLQYRGRTVDSVVALLEFPSSDALRNQLRRYADLMPTDLRHEGLRSLVDVFAVRREQDEWNLRPLRGRAG